MVAHPIPCFSVVLGEDVLCVDCSPSLGFTSQSKGKEKRKTQHDEKIFAAEDSSDELFHSLQDGSDTYPYATSLPQKIVTWIRAAVGRIAED